MTVSIQPVDRQTWQQLAPSFLDYNYRQLWDFGGACAQRVGAFNEHVAVYDGDELIGLADVRIKCIPFLKTGIAYINGGPLIRRNGDEDDNLNRLQITLTELVEVYVKQKKLVMRIQLPLAFDSWSGILNKTFMDIGFDVGTHLQPYRTFVVDLGLSLEVIRKQFLQKWRNCLNNSEKRNLTVKTGVNNHLFAEFISLFGELKQRKDFDVQLSPEFYTNVQDRLPEGERFYITIVCENDQPAAGHIGSFLGDTSVYLLGATNRVGLQNKAAYLAQWSFIQEAKARGCRFYDLGGIDPDENPGVYRFKKGMGGIDVTAPGPFEYYPDMD